jgi:non-specific serine/threonine protein kinase
MKQEARPMRASTDHSFGELLSRHRHARGWTQEELAERAGMSSRGISDLERGARLTPQPYTILQLIDAFGMSSVEREVFQAAAQKPSRSSSIGRKTPVSNLPHPSTPFIGRRRELETVVAMMRQPEIRLLTLTGTGGTGKTRLAIQAAADLLPDYTDGVIFVALAAVTDPALVPSAIIQSFEIRETTNRTLPEALSGRDMLLVLDNFEQVAPAATTIATMLDLCPKITILVTSRAPLQVSAEHEFPVPPFALPDMDRLPGFEELAQYDVIQLFSNRARAVQPAFELDERNVAAVASIASRLEGLPLAIELAAARSKVLSPRAMLDRLERRLPLLTNGAHDAPARHHTLRNAIAWSYDLLDRDSMALFRRLSVFAGGFSLAAATAVLSFPGDALPELAVLDQVSLLVDRSLVVRANHVSDDPRFTMLETLREFAHEQLVASGELPRMAEAHVQYFHHLAREAEPQLTESGQLEWFNLLEMELPNIRLALEWAMTHQPAMALELSGALVRFWDHHSHIQEGLFWLESAIAAGHDGQGQYRAKALWGAGVLRLIEGDLEKSRHFLTASLALARESGDDYVTGFALNGLGSVSLNSGDPVLARTYHEEGLMVLRRVGDKDGIAALLGNLGYGALVRGDIDQAIEFCSESLSLYRELGSDHGVASTLGNLGRSWLESGDTTSARAMLLEGLMLGQDIGNKWYITLCMEGLAGAAVLDQQWECGVRLFGAVEMISTRSHVTLPPFDLRTNARFLALAESQLDRSTFDAAWNAGQAMSIEDAITDAIDSTGSLSGSGTDLFSIE